MLDKLREQCNKLMNKDKEKYLLISNILSNDKCFFEMEVQTAYQILRDLEIEEEKIKEVYLNLIRYENYK